MTHELRAALEAVVYACPQHHRFWHAGTYPVWLGPEYDIQFAVATFELSSSAVCAAAHAYTWWKRERDRQVHDTTPWLRAHHNALAWGRLLDILDPDDVRPLAEPFACRGKQGLWPVEFEPKYK
jgi:hypothetical protein